MHKLNEKTCDQLRDTCRELKLPVSGAKKVLMLRICDSLKPIVPIPEALASESEPESDDDTPLSPMSDSDPEPESDDDLSDEPGVLVHSDTMPTIVRIPTPELPIETLALVPLTVWEEYVGMKRSRKKMRMAQALGNAAEVIQAIYRGHDYRKISAQEHAWSFQFPHQDGWKKGVHNVIGRQIAGLKKQEAAKKAKGIQLEELCKQTLGDQWDEDFTIVDKDVLCKLIKTIEVANRKVQPWTGSKPRAKTTRRSNQELDEARAEAKWEDEDKLNNDYSFDGDGHWEVKKTRRGGDKPGKAFDKLYRFIHSEHGWEGKTYNSMVKARESEYWVC